MKKFVRMLLFLLAFLLVASPVHPASQDVAPLAPVEAESYFAVAEAEGVAVYLSNAPCPAEVAKTGGLRPEFLSRYSLLRVVADNVFYRGCYRPHGEAYLMFLENGERAAAPKIAFQPIEKPTH